MFGTRHFVLCGEVVLFSEVILYRVYIVLCLEVCPLLECPLSEVTKWHDRVVHTYIHTCTHTCSWDL